MAVGQCCYINDRYLSLNWSWLVNVVHLKRRREKTQILSVVENTLPIKISVTCPDSIFNRCRKCFHEALLDSVFKAFEVE